MMSLPRTGGRQDMATNYADTVSMYYTFPITVGSVIQMPPPWRYSGQGKDANFHHWFVKQERSFLAFYPEMHGHVWLFVTYSVPRLMHKNGSNTFNVQDFDEAELYERVAKEIEVFPWAGQPFAMKMPGSFSDWQVSRIDLFLMHKIPPKQRQDYMDSYSLLMLPRHRPEKYMNTFYLNSSLRPDRKSNKVFRVYPKLQEISDRARKRSAAITGEDYPLAVHRKHEEFLNMDEKVEDFIRFEWMLRRSVIRYECGKHPTVSKVLSQQFQESVLAKMVSAVGLNLRILSRNDFKAEARRVFKTEKTYQNALQLARQVRNGQNVSLSRYQAGFVKKELKKNGIHYITNRYITLLPVKFP